MMTEQNFIINYLHKRHFPQTPSHFDNNVIVSNTAFTKIMTTIKSKVLDNYRIMEVARDF